MEEQLPLVSNVDTDAIVRGGAIAVDSPRAIGLYIQIATVGFLFGLIPALNYPLFNVYLQMEGYQTASYAMLVNLGWSLKVVFGMLSDCIPIGGYRRKSWMLIGWAIAFVGLVAMAILPLGAPYCDRARTTYCHTPYASVPLSDRRFFNVDAPNQGSSFILLSMIVSMGYVIAGSAADALIVELSQREPMATRGRLQTICTACRSLGGMPALLIPAFGLNGIQYNGSFSFALSPNMPYALSLVPCVVAAIAVVLLVQEPATSSSPGVRAWGTAFWALIQRRELYQICAVKFAFMFFRCFETTALGPIQANWVHMEPLTLSLATLASNTVYAITLAFVYKHGLQWDWRWAMALSLVAANLLDAAVVFPTTWARIRNQWFFAGGTILEWIPIGVTQLVGTLCVIEIIQPGTEGTIYGLVMSVTNLGQPLAAIAYKYVDSFIDVSQDAIKRDSTIDRYHVTTVYVISYTVKMLALVSLLWLPAQKAQVQAMQRQNKSSPVAGGLLLGLFVVGIALSVTSNVLSIFPSTKCYRLAGGNGANGKCP
ncbi:Aste57867_25539 [Aphanomyces stellatus]|uniref:Aste57867_25539 protein n=1 Tax=Aphanomyces stellatus TaxID=120398 RepID=A0A485LTJ9_9STRA|nr:hypothetical protein As57867_025460 [Aphanomyces stellatus]VFU02162.1 Aste57867_25539 [Aphanomyces stellatus]